MAKRVAEPEPPRIVVVDGVSYEVRRVPWGTIGVGSIILDRSDRRWTCIDAAVPTQFEYGKSCWLKFRAPRGEEFTAKPRYVTSKTMALIDPTAPPIEPAWPVGAREAWLLAQELGAVEIATQDAVTGEVWCPDYILEDGPGLGLPRPAERGAWPLIHHLEICHGVDMTALTAAYVDDLEGGARAIERAHEDAHKRPVGGGGFAHRHMPEDLSLL